MLHKLINLTIYVRKTYMHTTQSDEVAKIMNQPKYTERAG